MKLWNSILTMGLLVAFSTIVMQELALRRLNDEQREDRKLLHDATKAYLEACIAYRDSRKDDAAYRALLLRHNKLLISNVENGRLEIPNEEKPKRVGPIP